jgi:uncharacterized BrkB/YihY/UPF0761 family membrane protein
MQRDIFTSFIDFLSRLFTFFSNLADAIRARFILRRLRKLLPSLYPFGRTIYLFFDRFDRHDGFLSTSAISFSALTSSLPLLLLVLSFWGKVLQNKSRMLSVEIAMHGIDRFIPGLESEFSLAVRTLSESSTLLGGIALLGFIWFAGSLFYNIESGINRLFGLQTVRSFWHRTFYSFLIMALGYTLLISALLTTVAVAIISDLKISVFGISHFETPFLLNVFFETGPFILVFLYLYLVYRLIPAIDIRKQAAFISAISPPASGNSPEEHFHTTSQTSPAIINSMEHWVPSLHSSHGFTIPPLSSFSVAN